MLRRKSYFDEGVPVARMHERRSSYKWMTAPATAVGNNVRNHSAQAGEIVAAVKGNLGPGNGADLTPREVCDLEHEHGVALKWNTMVKMSDFPSERSRTEYTPRGLDRSTLRGRGGKHAKVTKLYVTSVGF